MEITDTVLCTWCLFAPPLPQSIAAIPYYHDPSFSLLFLVLSLHMVYMLSFTPKFQGSTRSYRGPI